MIGSAIYEILSNHAGLSALVGDNIFAMIADEDAKLPYVVYSTAVQAQYSKIAVMQDTYLIHIDMWARRYSKVNEIALEVRRAIEGVAGTFNGIKIHTIRIVEGEDQADPSDDTMGYTFTFEVKTSPIR